MPEGSTNSGVHLDSFLLAEAISAHENRLYVHGGGLTRLDVPMVPWVQSQLSLFARFRSEPQGFAEQHHASLRIVDPLGADVLPETELPFAAAQVREPVEGEERFINLIVTLGPLQLKQEGTYKLELRVHEKTARQMNLPVRILDSEAGGWKEVPAPE